MDAVLPNFFAYYQLLLTSFHADHCEILRWNHKDKKLFMIKCRILGISEFFVPVSRYNQQKSVNFQEPNRSSNRKLQLFEMFRGPRERRLLLTGWKSLR